LSIVPTIMYGQTLKKSQKCLYTASPIPDGGASTLVRTTKLFVWDDGSQTTTIDYSYHVRTTKAGIETIVLTNGTWRVPLCDNATADSCDYDATGTLLLSGILPSPQPQGFNPALQNGQVIINLLDPNGSVLASGPYTLAQPCSVRWF
jgi:hypothetical protein